MVRLALLLMLVILAIAPVESVAKGAVWRKKTVVVNDYTSADYKPYVAEMVAAFNAMLPPRAPRLIYRPQPARPCSEIRFKRVRGIAVCTGAAEDLAVYDVERGEITRAVVKLMGNDAPEFRHAIICHELMHAVTDAPEAYSNPHEGTSCVQGLTDFPGEWDAGHARKVYKRHR